MDEPQNNPVPQTPADGDGKPTDELAACRQEAGNIKRERDEYLNGWKRAKADLINYQRDESKRFQEASASAGLEVVQDIIPVLDNFYFALEQMKREGKSEQGLAMVNAQFEDVLAKKGLEIILAPPGTPFDPNVHEAVEEVESTHPPGAVAEEVERGYKLNGRIIKPARVKMAKLPIEKQKI